MLSRLADSFFWLGRNVERAETVARVLDVSITRAIDLEGDARWTQRLWRGALAIGTLSEPATVTVYAPEARYAVERCVFALDNPASLLSCVTIARNNAIEARVELTTEVWEHINELYLDVQAQTPGELGQTGALPFLRRVRDRCQAIAGAIDATMLHAEGWDYLQLGRFVERAYLAVRALATIELLDDPWPEWQRLLELCCASHPFVRACPPGSGPREAIAFLLFEPAFPRSLRFCVDAIDRALHRISHGGRSFSNAAEKRAGALAATIAFSDVSDVHEEGLAAYLRRVTEGLVALVAAVEADFFARVPLALEPVAVSEPLRS